MEPAGERPKLPGVILAAGRSSRMGRDKALLPLRGSTFIGLLAGTFKTACDPVIVVTGHHAAEVAAAVPSAGGVRVAVNERYDCGMLSSLQTGLRAVGGPARGVVFTLVDHPEVKPGSLRALIEEFERTGAPVAIPRYRGQRGHPVAVSWSVAAELLALPPDGSAKDVIRAWRPQTCFVDLDDPAIVQDVDEPADYEQLIGGSRAP